MVSDARYRIAAVFGTAVVTLMAVLVSNVRAVQVLFVELIPLETNFGRAVLRGQTIFTGETTLTGEALLFAVLTTTVATLVALVPLYKPRRRRILDTILLTQRRVLLASVSLAAIGYFDYTYRLPRTTLLLTTITLLAVLPLWFLVIRHRPRDGETTVVIGNSWEEIRSVAEQVEEPIAGYLMPPYQAPGEQATPPEMPDGGAVLSTEQSTELTFLGGPSRLEQTIVDQNVDTAILAYAQPDRSEFFGTLDTCYEYDVTAKVEHKHADYVLVDHDSGGELLTVDLEPWDWQDHALKRAFDAGFATLGLAALAPLMLVIAAAIRLDSPGPIFYSQERTAEFGDTFEVYKFRTMLPESEQPDPVEDAENDRITRVGALLRKTHLDEIPQLWSILVGDMSVVGPRAVWRDEEQMIESETTRWRKRWFVKPGLTGLAQINDATSTTPETKLQYDMEYIRRQSLRFDTKIVLRQFWKVALDVTRVALDRESSE